MLALAHYVERLVEEGSVKSYADAARQLGVTRARILHLLIEEVRYDAEAGEVAITFRPGGVRSLAREDGKETA